MRRPAWRGLPHHSTTVLPALRGIGHGANVLLAGELAGAVGTWRSAGVGRDHPHAVVHGIAGIDHDLVTLVEPGQDLHPL